jgi:CRISP-associated protein Cas1
MNPLLIQGFGTTINVDKRRLIIKNPHTKETWEFYPHQIDYDTIIIDGHTGNISFEAMRWITKHGIHLTLLNWDGNLLGTWTPKETNMGKVRVKQYEKYLDNKTRLIIAEEMVREKVEKSLQLLLELSRFYPELDTDYIKSAFTTAQDNYQATTKKQPSNNSNLNQLLLYEGSISMIYWDQLAKIFNTLYPQFNYKNRKNKSYSWNMNASDEINALLNYGYAVLESQIRKYINAVGLDPAVGFLHELAPSKTPLVYDLQELYRWLVDLSIIELLEGKKLKKSDFLTTENYHIRLKESTAKELIERIINNFNNRSMYKKRNSTYDTILQDNVQQLANYLVERTKQPKFDIPALQISRNDDHYIRDTLLNMTPEERRSLGINRNTLWYIKKNLRDGKKIELYTKVKTKIA